MKRRLFKLLKISVLLGAFLLFGGALFVIYTLSEIPLERLDSYKERPLDANKLYLEEGSLVNKQELQTFQLFNGSKMDPKAWWQELLKSGKIREVGGGLVSINSRLELSNLLENHCERLYCYQHRMEFKNIPSLFWKGLIGIEDFRFLSHIGVDPKSILRALITDIMEMRFVQGGSTLTQQLAKNLYYSNEKTITRKIKEVIAAIYIESEYSKENILEAYFNEFVWGSQQGIRIKGLYAASLYYFDQKPDRLSPYQASILVAILNGPYFFHPIRNLDRLIKKTNTLYRRLVGLNFFSGNHQWNKEKWEAWRASLIQKNKEKAYKSLWWSEKLDSGVFNSYEKFSFVKKANNILKKVKERAPKKDLSIKAFFAKPFENNNQTFTYYSKFERSHNKAIQRERHQVGSTLKPIIYSLIVKNTTEMKSLVSTEPLTLKLKSGKWSPREAHKGLPAQVSIEEALLKSYNRPLIRLAQEFGFDSLEERLEVYIPDLKKPLGEYPAQLLGAVELSVRELHNAYSTFLKSQCSEMENSTDNILYLLSDPRQTTVRRQLGKHMGQMRFFGKTGTSNNGYDNWYVSFDGENLGVIWVGLEGPRQGDDIKLYGGSTAFKIYHDFSRDRGVRFHELSCPSAP